MTSREASPSTGSKAKSKHSAGPFRRKHYLQTSMKNHRNPYDGLTKVDISGDHGTGKISNRTVISLMLTRILGLEWEHVTLPL